MSGSDLRKSAADLLIRLEEISDFIKKHEPAAKGNSRQEDAVSAYFTLKQAYDKNSSDLSTAYEAAKITYDTLANTYANKKLTSTSQAADLQPRLPYNSGNRGVTFQGHTSTSTTFNSQTSAGSAANSDTAKTAPGAAPTTHHRPPGA